MCSAARRSRLAHRSLRRSRKHSFSTSTSHHVLNKHVIFHRQVVDWMHAGRKPSALLGARCVLPWCEPGTERLPASSHWHAPARNTIPTPPRHAILWIDRRMRRKKAPRPSRQVSGRIYHICAHARLGSETGKTLCLIITVS